MTHTHGNGTAYQVRIVHEDGTEELSGWMTSEAQVAPALAAIHRPHGTAYWLRARTVHCPDCREREQDIWECPLAGIPTLPARDPTTLYSIVIEIVTAAQRAA